MEGAFVTAQLQTIVSVEFVGMDGILPRREVANVERIVEGGRLGVLAFPLKKARKYSRACDGS